MRDFTISLTSGPPGTPWHIIFPCAASPHISPVEGLMEALSAEEGREEARYFVGRMGPKWPIEYHGLTIAVDFIDDVGARCRPNSPGLLVRAWRAAAVSHVLFPTPTGARLVLIFARAEGDATLAEAAADGARRLVSQFLVESDLHVDEFAPGRMRPGFLVDEEESRVGGIHYLPRGVVGGSRWGGPIHATERVPLFEPAQLARLAETLPPLQRPESSAASRPSLGRTIASFFGALAGKEL